VSTWTADEGWQDVGRAGPRQKAAGAPAGIDPLADLDARLKAHTPAEVEGLPRFWGGAVGFFSYDIVRWIEQLPDAPPDDLGLPDGLFVFTDLVLAIDNLKGRAMAIAAVPVGVHAERGELRARYDEAAAKIDALVETLDQASPPPALALAPEPEADPTFESSMSREAFEAGVERIREYILAGDAFQVVPVLPGAGRRFAHWEFTRSPGAGRGRDRHRAAHRRDAASWCDAGRGALPRGGPAR
jgi:anthranilate synthase component 1